MVTERVQEEEAENERGQLEIEIYNLYINWKPRKNLKLEFKLEIKEVEQ